jgi:hypothetical protein
MDHSLGIISCEHCQVSEDRETVFGIGSPLSLEELPEAHRPLVCPNCHAKLEESDFIMIDIPWTASEKTFPARSKF